MDADTSHDEYAREVANASYNWYAKAAIRSRRLYRLSTVTTLVSSAAIPLSAALAPGNATIPAILGSVVVISAGLQTSFHWHENYLRFSHSRESVEAERRRYRTAAPPYEDSDGRAPAMLVERISRIEGSEMKSWIEISTTKTQGEHPKQIENSADL